MKSRFLKHSYIQSTWYWIEKIPHVKKWGTTQYFFFAFIDEFEKEIIIKKTVVNKKQNNFNIYNIAFFFKNRNTCWYHSQNLDDMIYRCWDKGQSILKLVILGHFLPFYPSKNPKTQNFEKWKKLLEISFYTCVPKITIYDVRFPRYRVR